MTTMVRLPRSCGRVHARRVLVGMHAHASGWGWFMPSRAGGLCVRPPCPASQGGPGLTKPWGDSAQGFPCCWGTSSEAFAGRHVENIFHEVPDHSGVWVHLFE
jgi:hypothetical protein